jgi:2Fe-2S ferredoxin
MTTIYATDKEGNKHAVDAKDGLSAMEVLRPLDIGIDGECEGSLACATCHVWVDENWVSKLGARSEEEEDMLDTAFLVRNTSRLCCQIKIAPELSGLELAVPRR